MSTRLFLSSLAIIALVIVGGTYVVSTVSAQHPADVYSLATASRDSKNCSGSHCTLTATYTDWHSGGNLIPGWAGLNVAMSMDTALLPYSISPQTSPYGYVPPGSPFTINIKGGGEIVGHAVSFFDSPPIRFQSGGVAYAETDGLTVCLPRPVIAGVPLSCSGSSKTSGIKDIVGKWQDSYRVFNANGQAINSITCSSNAAGTQASCRGNASGKVKIELTRSVTDMRWQTGNKRLPLSGNKIFPAEMKSSVFVEFGDSSAPTPTPTPQPPVACSAKNKHATRIIGSTRIPARSQYGPETVLGAPKSKGISVGFSNEGSQKGFVTVGFASNVTIVDGPGKDFVVHYEHANERFEVFVHGKNGQRRSLAVVPNKYPLNTSGSLPAEDLGLDIGASGLNEVVAVEIVNLENSLSDGSEGPDLRGFTVINCQPPVTPTPTATPTVTPTTTATPTSSPSVTPTTTPVPQCSDSLDNDVDGLIDSADPGCHSDGDPNNSNTYLPGRNNEVNTPAFDPGGFQETD